MNLAKLALERSEPLPAFVQKRVIPPCGRAKISFRKLFTQGLDFYNCNGDVEFL